MTASISLLGIRESVVFSIAQCLSIPQPEKPESRIRSECQHPERLASSLCKIGHSLMGPRAMNSENLDGKTVSRSAGIWVWD